MRNVRAAVRVDDSPTFTWGVPMRRLEPPAEPLRVYHDRLIALLIRCGAALATLLILTVGVAPSLSTAARVLALLVAVAAIWIGYRGGRMRVAVTPAGLWLDNGLFARWLPWAAVEKFTAVPWGFNAEIRVKTRGRSKPYRAALVQGRKMRWGHGCTVDILGTLTADLAAARDGSLGSGSSRGAKSGAQD